MVLQELPLTFQHAIAVTRALGIQYLWIDAICIIQDDDKDWEVESGNMASIYGNSYLTISATSSSSPAAGLAPMRAAPRTFEHTDDEGDSFSVFVRPLLEHNFLSSSVFVSDKFPALRGGWCFQERYLSPRVVHFLEEEMAWDCGQHRRCQCGGFEWRPHQCKNQLRDIISKLRVAQQNGLTLDELSKKEVWAILAGWDVIPDDYYCRATLTYDIDILQALSGIATSIQDAGLGRYLAGLWRFRLEDQLMWCARSDWTHSFGRRPSSYTAPTFSPLSRIGEVSLGISTPGVTSRIHGKILRARCRPKGLNKLGAVKSGHIKLQAPLVSVKVASSTVTGFGWDGCHIEGFVGPGDKFEMRWIPDADEIPKSIQPGEQLYLLRIRDDNSLVLIRDPTDRHSFNRLGVCFEQETVM